ncbi:MAG: hypothetical protein ACPG7F_03545 [Aggregatilineales bacterium]
MTDENQPISQPSDEMLTQADAHELDKPLADVAPEMMQDSEDTDLDLLFVSEMPPEAPQIYEGDTAGTPTLDSFDIDAALAAVASLSTLAGDAVEADSISDNAGLHPESDIADIADELVIEGFDVEVDTDVIDEASDAFIMGDDGELPDVTGLQSTEAPTFEDVTAPPMFYIQRGQMASVIPAVLLLAGAGGLAAILLSETIVLTSGMIVAGLCGAIGLMMLGQWFSSKRWSAGNFFIGMMLVLLSGTALYLMQPESPGLAAAPLFVVVSGLALVLTATFTPIGRGVLAFGLMISVAGLAALMITANLVELPLDMLTTVAPVPVVIFVIILIMPLLRRR